MMKYNNMQRLLSAALLFAFTVPISLANTVYSQSAPYSSAMQLSGNVKLTDKNNNITLSLRNSDVKQVLRMFADKAGMNIVFHSSVEGEVTLDMVNMPINDAFKLVLQIVGLNYYTQGNTLVIIAKDSEDNASFSKQEMMVFPVKYVSATKIADFLNKNVFGMKKTGMSSVDAATVNTATNEVIVFGMESDAAIVQKVIDQLDREPLSKTFAVNHTTPAEMANMICNLLLPSRGSVNGSSSSSSSGSSSSLGSGSTTGGAASVSGGSGSTGGELKLGEGVVACTITPTVANTTTSSFDVQNLAVSYYPQRGTITLMGGSEAQIAMVEKFIKDNDVKQPQAYLEVSIVELNEQGSKEFSNNWAIQSKAWNFTFNGGTSSGGREGGVGQRVYDVTEHYWVEPSYNEDGTFNPPQYIAVSGKKPYPGGNSSYISWQMNYLVENRKARVLANPKLLITNGQESVIDLTQDYVEKVTSEFLSSTGAGVGAVGTVQRTYTIGEDKGIKVTLTPFISPEGYVTLNITPEFATEVGQVTTPSITGSGTDIQATLLSRRNLDLKNIRIKDGETLVIGGMIQEEDSKVVQKIPVLGDLPVIGTIFRTTTSRKTKSELVIMITPKIINDGEGAVADNL